MRNHPGKICEAHLRSPNKHFRQWAVFEFSRKDMTKRLCEKEVVTGIAEALTTPLSKEAKKRGLDALKRFVSFRKLPDEVIAHFCNSLETADRGRALDVALKIFHNMAYPGEKEKLTAAVFARALSDRLCTIGEIEYLIYADAPPITVRAKWTPPRSLVLAIGETLHDKDATAGERQAAERLLRRLHSDRRSAMAAIEALAIGRYGPVAGGGESFVEDAPEEILVDPMTSPDTGGKLTLDLAGMGKDGMKVRGFSFSMDWGRNE